LHYESFISRRYLFSRERGALVTIITLISILGVAIGVAALVVVISVMDGADEDLFRTMIDIDAHAEITSLDQGGFENYREIIKAVESVPGVKGVAPAIMRQAVVIAVSPLTGEAVPEGILIAGIDPERELEVTGINRHTFPPDHGPPADREIVLGLKLAEHLNKRIGEPVRVLTDLGTFGGHKRPMQRDLKVVGLLRTNLYDFDRNAAYVSLHQAQELFMLDDMGDPMDVVTSIRISLDDPFNMEPVRQGIIKAVSPIVPKAIVQTWQDKNQLFFNALKLEKIALFIILLLIIIVAAFNIIGTQILVVLQKTREVGILMSMGVPRRSVLRVFWGFGFTIGVLGTAVGVALGLIICYVLATTDIISLEASVYGISKLPVKVNITTVSFIVFCSMAICMLASVFPAWRASRMNPVEALRYE